MKIAIDLLWVKPNKSGGIESYIKNLLQGFIAVNIEHKIILILSNDNIDSFQNLLKFENFSYHLCPINSCNVKQTILWENFKLDKLISKLNVDFCFVPFYRKPLFTKKNNKYIVTIHDLQALHFPEYFSFLKLLWLKFAWRQSVKSAYHIIAISEFVKKDIITRFKCNSNKITTIYNPILCYNEFASFQELSLKYEIKTKDYYYTISSLLKHKNLITILKLIKKIKDDANSSLPNKLVISGIKGNEESTLKEYIKENNIEDNCIFTGYISEGDKNTLIKNSRLFLFPSIFEGFGMPIIESIKLGTNVVTTKLASIPEVSKGLCTYVNDPFDIEEWFKALEIAEEINVNYTFPEYNIDTIALEYIKMFETCENYNK